MFPSMPDTLLFDSYNAVACADLASLMSADMGEVEREFEAITGDDSDGDANGDLMMTEP